MNSTIIRYVRQSVRCLAATCLVVVMAAQPAYAITQDQINVLNQGIYFFNTEINTCYQPTAGGATPASTTLVGSDNIQKAFNFFVGQGLTPVQSAAILGNLEQESGGGAINPASEQVAGAWNDLSSAVDKGVGIAQWDGGRRPALINTAKSEGKDPKDLGFQLGYLWNELSTTYANVLQHLKAATAVDDAVNQFTGPLDRSGHPAKPTDEVARSGGYENPGKPIMANRIKYANTILNSPGLSAGASGASCGVSCSNSSGTTTANLSPVRQQVVCLAQQELAAWTPPPAVPRLQYTKYTEGWECNGGAAPQGNGCGSAGNEFWCADFASWLYKQAGYPFSGGHSGWRLPAVKQIQDLPTTDSHFHLHAANGYTPVPGDLAIHSYGHVTVVVSVSGGLVSTIGGDQGADDVHSGGPQSTSVVSTDNYPGSQGDSTTYYVSPD